MRAVLSGGAGEPGFWPSRGRRGGGDTPDDPAPPFWAHRGRETLPLALVGTPCIAFPTSSRYQAVALRPSLASLEQPSLQAAFPSANQQLQQQADWWGPPRSRTPSN